MHLRTIIGGTLALLLLSGGSALSRENHFPQPGGATPQPQIGLPGVFDTSGRGEEIRVAQAVDPRVTVIEEQLRQMSGTIEELNFQILQMQEQLRKMQEDNDYRFQQLEQKKSGALGGDSGSSVAASKPSAPAAAASASAATPPPGQASATDSSTASHGAPPQAIGTIVFDAQGNVKGGSIGDQVPVGGAPAAAGNGVPADDGDHVAALPATDDPDELYRNAYEFILSGDYKTAEAGFRDHVRRYPADPRTSDARFWLGESLLGQQKYRDAAEIFLAASKEYPSSKKAPEMLLKLGVSLSGLKQRDVACATFNEIGKRYPGASPQLMEQVKKERAAAAC